MTITGALNNAMSGLRAAGRASQVVSANISNAMTPGYGVRNLELSSSEIGGVRIMGINRSVDPVLLSDLRFASAAFGNATDRTGFLKSFESLLGTPDQSFSLTARLADFEKSLVTAASRPDAGERLDAAVHAARDLAASLSDASTGLQEARSRADQNIERQVSRLNSSLAEVKELNSRISRAISTGADVSALEDSRQALVDEISTIAPVRQLQRDGGQIALYSTGGAILLDGGAAEIGFEGVNQVTAYMSVDDNSLSGLTLNGIPIRTDSLRGALRGGTLGAQFEVRDELSVKAQAKLDAVARDLVERFQNPAVDPSLSPGDPGLFTDAGQAFDPLAELGLAQRISVNASVDPQRGGSAWRMRDGINAASPGEVGNALLLQALTDTLLVQKVPASGDFGGGAFSAINLASELSSQAGSDRYQAEQKLAYSSGQFSELTALMLAQGVDTDNELQRLLLIEQTFAANARIIEAVDEMMQSIIRL